ncbi:MAG: hypothetical protein R3A44_44375 [Caldilineaceae bacterium]
MATDNFSSYQPSLDAPARRAAAVTPNDSADLTEVPRALYIGTAGDLVVKLVDDASSVTFPNMPVGWHPIRPARVYATNTTASDIVAVY